MVFKCPSQLKPFYDSTGQKSQLNNTGHRNPLSSLFQDILIWEDIALPSWLLFQNLPINTCAVEVYSTYFTRQHS